jgi:hypothetical protein
MAVAAAAPVPRKYKRHKTKVLGDESNISGKHAIGSNLTNKLSSGSLLMIASAVIFSSINLDS